MAKELLPGNVLQNGKYKIVKVLGISSFGITYKALTSVQDSGIPNNTQVAVKEFFMHDFSHTFPLITGVIGIKTLTYSGYSAPNFITEAPPRECPAKANGSA